MASIQIGPSLGWVLTNHPSRCSDGRTIAATASARGHHLRLVTILAGLFALLAVAAAPAIGTVTEEQQGAQHLSDLQSGKSSCASLSTANFELIGEFVMGRMLGSSAAHAAMNRQITSAMGSSGERQAHVFMGQRFAGCATGRAPGGFGAMMGMMGTGMMSSASGPTGNAGAMGAGYGGGGAMMGSGYSSQTGSHHGGQGGPDNTFIGVVAGLLILVAIGAYVVLRGRRGRTGTPLETLQARYAKGEIGQEDFDRRRQALGGTI